jgi:signal transduction histidine kinase/CheY-like chemotaxis protein
MRGEPSQQSARASRPRPSDALARLQDEVDLLRLQNERLLDSQAELEAQRDLYAGVYDRSPVPCLLLDWNGVIRIGNAAASELLGVPGGKLAGRAFSTLVVEQDRPAFLRHLQGCRTATNVGQCGLAVMVAGRGAVAIDLWSAPMEHGEQLYPCVLMDVTDRLAGKVERNALRAAEQAARAESDAKDQFIATLSHELRTPLTPVLAAVSALAMQDPPPPPSRQMLEMIKRNVVAEARLIDDLLDVARIRRGKLLLQRQPLDVHETVRQALEVLAPEARGKDLRVEVELSASAHHASADPLRLRQVFWNLIGNAVKFTPQGGTIAVRSWNRDDALAVEIRDSGVGLAAGELERLFRPFEQGPDEGQGRRGLGLGLAIARGVAELHGGRIVGTSPGPGSGSRFIVELSTVPAPEARPPEPVAAPPMAIGHQRILLIEDHRDTADSLSELLGGEGYEVEQAASAAAALTVDLDRIDLVVSDLGLPDRSGHDLLRELRSRRRLPAIALSGYGTEADVRASLDAGFSVHLTKPVDWPDLLAAIVRVAATPS